MTQTEKKVLKAQEHDSKARHELINSYEQMTRQLAGKFFKSNGSCCEDMEDLRSIAMTGLIHAIDSWEQDKGQNFSGWAYCCIRQTLIQHQRYAHRQKCALPHLRLEQEVDSAEDGQHLLRSLIELVADDSMAADGSEADFHTLLYEICTALGKRQRIVLCCYFGLGVDPFNMREIAEIVCVSKGTVYNDMQAALEVLQNAVETQLEEVGRDQQTGAPIFQERHSRRFAFSSAEA